MLYCGSVNMKKRKFLYGTVEELNLPEPKHTCCEAAIGSACDALMTSVVDGEDTYTIVNKGPDNIDYLDMRVKLAQDSNSFLGDSQSSAEVRFDASIGKADSYDEISAYWSNTGSTISRLDSRLSSTVADGDEEIMSSNGGQYSCQSIGGWHDNDCLEDCFIADDCKDYRQQTAEGLEEFLSSSGINPNELVQSSERWSLDEDVQPGRRKPTIDQEFEQYFSMLML